MGAPEHQEKTLLPKTCLRNQQGKRPERIEKEGQLIPEATLDMDAHVTSPFLENLFTTSLKQELTADIKDIRRNMGELEQRIDSLERGSDNRDEELEEHK
ncbi:hypothetical protein NDU88_010335 [Pleurodeles waltl]|uniref:Uncharacterized protein n=1 Tax=Pleurodeles waltl TaxID=8319 RepID=A0AAV7S1M2_PLEWA|nr:hypothetical protein NDU88_010335 [Pleurodeles waltl]